MGMGKFSLPHKKAVGSGHTRLHNVAIKKIIDGNLTVLTKGTFLKEYLHIFSGQNNWQKKHWQIKFHLPNPPMFFTTKVLCYMVSLNNAPFSKLVF